MKIRININFVLIFLMFLPPLIFGPFINDTALVKQISTLILLSSILFFIFFKIEKRNIGKGNVSRTNIFKLVSNDIVFAVFFIYTLYMLIDILLKQIFIISAVSNRDIGEILRVVFVFLSFFVGFLYSKESINWKLFYKIIIIIFILLIYGFIFTHGNFILNKFYNSEQHRFSGIMPGINYIWIPLIIFLFSFFQFKQNKIFLLLNFLVVLISLVLAASFTAIIVFIVLLTIYYFMINSFKKFIVNFTILLVVFSVIIYFVYSYLTEMQVGVVTKLSHLYEFFLTFDLSQFSSLEARFIVWQDIWNKFLEFPLTGHGSDKTHLVYTDNSYLMTLYRYGIIGLILENSLLLLLFINFIKKTKYSKEFHLPILLILGEWIASLTTNVMYELKAPYLLFFIYGYFYGKGKRCYNYYI